ncbi:hypothetical protein FJQ87_02375 [Shewanella sp. SNU WT4]|uniref:hypothetical protein n=1 Tax=Shewanella sp. SNU WT4 TaxID=2590015 RepID=UPI00112B9B82|nr:hypothetical protein [Shewanella sp. SNU WT4]QDF65673.1 hypothetical protein FJQ87_02375 [Shewanella sp. SNU WT4]
MSLDSLYAMLARPVTAVMKAKPQITEVSKTAPSSADDHQTKLVDLPQPPKSQSAAPDKANQRQYDRRQQDRRHQSRAKSKLTASDDTSESPSPPVRQGGHIDIEI